MYVPLARPGQIGFVALADADDKVVELMMVEFSTLTGVVDVANSADKESLVTCAECV